MHVIAHDGSCSQACRLTPNHASIWLSMPISLGSKITIQANYIVSTTRAANPGKPLPADGAK